MTDDDLDKLIENLKSDDEDVRSSAVWALKEINDKRAVEPLIKALGDEVPFVRSSASRALGEIGDERAVEPLIKALEDEYCCGAAAEALGEIGDERAVEPLIKMLGDESVYVCRAVGALGKIGEPAVEPLIKALGDGDEDVRSYAAEALGELGWKPETDELRVAYTDAATILLAKGNTEALAGLGWEPETDELRIVFLLAKGDTEAIVKWGEPAVEPLIKALGAESWVVRRTAAKALGEIGDKRAVESLIAALEEGDVVTEAAAVALGNIGDSRALDPLIQVVLEQDDYSDEGEVAGKALAKIGGPRVAEQFSEMLGRAIYEAGSSDHDDGVQSAARALGCIGGARAAEFLIANIPEDNKTDYDKRNPKYIYCMMDIVIALGKTGAVQAVKPLLEALSDYYLDVRESAAAALGSLGEIAVPALVKALSAEDSGIRSGVGVALKEIGWEPDTDELKISYLIATEDWTGCVAMGETAVEPLIEALKTYPLTSRWGGETELDLRAGAAESLGNIGDGRAVEPLCNILGAGYDVMTAEEYTAEFLTAVVEALEKFGDSRAIKPLINTLGSASSGQTEYHDEKEVFETTMAALKGMGDSVVEPLVKLLGGDEHATRETAVKVLDELGWTPDTDEARATYLLVKGDAEALAKWGKPAVKPLIGALRDNHWEVRLKDNNNLSAQAAEREKTVATAALAKIVKASDIKEKANILRFLESKDPAMVLMGASMLKGILE